MTLDFSRRDARRRAALDPLRPVSFHVEEERSDTGEIVSVATIFLTNRECPWRCIYCDLWKNTLTGSVPSGAIPAQIDYALRELQTAGAGARQIKLYNAGSFFDRKAVSPEDFPAITERVRNFERVIVECHPALIGESAVAFAAMLSPARLEVAMGLEIADDAVLAKLDKRMTLEMFARASEFLNGRGIALRAFVIVKPPFVRTEQEALEQAQRSIDFAFDCGATVVSLIPARFGTQALDELAKRRDFAPPRLATVEAALDYGISTRRGRTFVDLWDVAQLRKCSRCFDARAQRLRGMNLSQTSVERIRCAACGASDGTLSVPRLT